MFLYLKRSQNLWAFFIWRNPMSVADLFATQTAFNQRGLYQDTPESNQAWKTAFDIANNFANSAEKFRQHDENMATSAYRVGAMNAENKQKIDLAPWQTNAGIAKAQYDTQTLPARAAYDISRYGDWTVNENARRAAQVAQYAWNTANANQQLNNAQTEQLAQSFYAQNAFDGNRVRSPEEVHNLAWEALHNGTLSPQAYNKFIQPYQLYSKQMSEKLAPLSPGLASSYGYMSGGFPYLIKDGQLINPDSGEAVAPIPAGVNPATLFTPKQTSANALDVANFNAQHQNQRDYRAALLKAFELSKSSLGDIDPALLETNIARVKEIYGDNNPTTKPATSTSSNTSSLNDKANDTFSNLAEMQAYYKELAKNAKTEEEKNQVADMYQQARQQRGW